MNRKVDSRVRGRTVKRRRMKIMSRYLDTTKKDKLARSLSCAEHRFR